MLCHVLSSYVMLCHVMSCYVMSCYVMLYYIKNVSIRITLLTVGLTVVVGSEKSKTNYLIVTNKKL